VKLIVCDKCEAEYKLLHNMNEGYYVVEYCTFCGEILNDDELQDEVELVGYEEED